MNEFQKQLDEKLAKAEIVPPKIIKVTIEEHISQTFEVEANDIEEAMQIAEQKYYDGEFVIESNNVTYKCMEADDGYESTEWVEF